MVQGADCFAWNSGGENRNSGTAWGYLYKGITQGCVRVSQARVVELVARVSLVMRRSVELVRHLARDAIANGTSSEVLVKADGLGTLRRLSVQARWLGAA